MFTLNENVQIEHPLEGNQTMYLWLSNIRSFNCSSGYNCSSGIYTAINLYSIYKHSGFCSKLYIDSFYFHHIDMQFNRKIIPLKLTSHYMYNAHIVQSRLNKPIFFRNILVSNYIYQLLYQTIY